MGYSMNILDVLSIILIIILITFGVEFYLKYKKIQNKKIETVKKDLILRINYIMILTVLLGITSIINIILKSILI